MKKRLHQILLIGFLSLTLVSAAVLTPACAPTAPSAVVTYTISDPTGDWGYPSPYLRYSRGPGHIRMSFIFDTLVWKDASGFIPALAEDWEYIEADNAYLFRLQHGVTWHDGEPQAIPRTALRPLPHRYRQHHGHTATAYLGRR